MISTGTTWWRLALRLAAAAAACALLVLLPAGPAAAHATLVSTDPAEGAVLEAVPDRVTFAFDESVTLPADGVRVFDATGEPVESSASSRDAVVSVDLPDELVDGTYIVAWRIVSADGHPVAGSLTFAIGAPSATVTPPPLDEPTSDSVTAALSVVHGILYLGLFLAVGLTLFLLLVIPHDRLARPVARLRRLRSAAAVVAAVAAVVALPLTSGYQQGLDLVSTLDPDTWTRPQTGELLGLVLLVAGLGLLLARPPRLALAGVALAAVSPALTGHSRAYVPQAPVITIDVLHVLAGSIWLGGLVGMAVALPALAGRPSAAVALLTRFSTVAAGVLLALAATGSLLAWRIVGSWSGLVGTTYGQLLLAKVAVVAVTVAIAAGNRFLLLPRTRTAVGFAGQHRSVVRIGRVVSAEATLLVGVLLLTGVLVNQSPRGSAAVVPEGRTGVESGQLSELKLLATVAPRRVGQNALRIQVQNAAGEPVESVHLPVVRVRSGNVDLGEVPVVSADAGTYGAEIVIPTAGRWEVQVSLRVSTFDNPVTTLAFDVPAI